MRSQVLYKFTILMHSIHTYATVARIHIYRFSNRLSFSTMIYLVRLMAPKLSFYIKMQWQHTLCTWWASSTRSIQSDGLCVYTVLTRVTPIGWLLVSTNDTNAQKQFYTRLMNYHNLSKFFPYFIKIIINIR